MDKFAKGDRVRIVKIVITEEDQYLDVKRMIAYIGKEGEVDQIDSSATPYYVLMDGRLDPYWWREEELERV